MVVADPGAGYKTSRVTIVMPVYDDWQAAFQLCERIDAVAGATAHSLRLILVDDGSVSSRPERVPFEPTAIERISVLTLRRNVGHQRAIAICLAHLAAGGDAGDGVLVMDADGEDCAEDIPHLLRAWQSAAPGTTMFAERGRRAEGLAFRFFYAIYRFLHRILTGRHIRFGNFSILSSSSLQSLVVCPELWNHYAATILKARLPYAAIRLNRGPRLAGGSKMNFVSLVIHGLSALFANQEVVATRLLVGVFVFGAVLMSGVAAVVGIRLLTALAIPGWATTAVGFLLVLLGQAATASAVIVFSIMMNRSQLGFLPIRDAQYFIGGETKLHPHD